MHESRKLKAIAIHYYVSMLMLERWKSVARLSLPLKPRWKKKVISNEEVFAFSQPCSTFRPSPSLTTTAGGGVPVAVSRSKAWPTDDSRTFVDNSVFETFPRNKGSLGRGQSGLFLSWKRSTKEQRRKKNGVEIRISSDSKNPFLGRDTDRRPITTCLECRRATFSNFAQLRARLAASPSFSTIEHLCLSGENTETLKTFNLACRIYYQRRCWYASRRPGIRIFRTRWLEFFSGGPLRASSTKVSTYAKRV